ncbi:MAG: DUF1552 domain-containing protein [Myxococcota bacterium]
MRRRNFLRGLGGIAVALPTLSVFRTARAAGGGATPSKMVVMAYPMGTHTPYWQPQGTGAITGLNAISDALRGYEDRCLFLSHFDNSIHDLVDAHGHGHPGKEATTLTGTLTMDALRDGRNHVDAAIRGGGAEGSAGGPSIEQVVGSYLQRRGHSQTAISLGISGGRESWDQRDTYESNFFYEAAETPATLITSVQLAFNRLFSGLVDEVEVDPTIEHLHARNRSVLDAVRASFVDLRQGLGAADRAILDDHMDKIRTLEMDIVRVASCSPPVGDFGGGDWSMPTVAPLQNRIAAMALACDMAPVARIEFANQQNPVFNLDSLNQIKAAEDTGWHGVVHLTGNTHPGRIAGFRFFMEMYASLLEELDALPDPSGEGTLLDNTLTLFASNFGPGNGHSARKMCMLLAGNLGGARTGYHVDATPGYDGDSGFYSSSDLHVNHIMNSVMCMAGVTDDVGRPVLTHGLQGFADDQVIDEIFR